MTTATRSLADFRGLGYDKGRPWILQALWFATQNLIFSKWWLPAALRPITLRVFGDEIGQMCSFATTYVSCGPGNWPLVTIIGSERTSGYSTWNQYRSAMTCACPKACFCAPAVMTCPPPFEYDNGPISIEDEVWLDAQSMILRGVTVGRGAVVATQRQVGSNGPAGALLASSGMREQSR